MSYRKAILRRWSHRDKISIVIVAVAVAFLVGSVVVVTAIGAQTTELAGGASSPIYVSAHDSVDEAVQASGSNATVVPYTRIVVSGEETYLIVRPPGVIRDQLGLQNRTDVTRGSLSDAKQEQLSAASSTNSGSAATSALTVQVRPRSQSSLPAEWYVAPNSTIQQLGADGAFVFHRVSHTSAQTPGTPLATALPFFLLGTRQALAALSAVIIGSGLLVGVVVYSVTRMAIRDRRTTIQIIRATGGTRRAVVGLFGLRAAILAAVGSALGYAVGIIALNSLTNIAIFLGLPVSLNVSLSSSTAWLVLLICVGVTITGGIAGVLAAWIVTGADVYKTGDDNRITDFQARVFPDIMTPDLLDMRAFVPTAAALSAFVVFLLVLTTIGSLAAPLTTEEGVTVTEPDAVHPAASTVPTTTADALHEQGINASPEILTLQVYNGQPYLARGANFTHLQSTNDVQVTDGRSPTASNEVTIGASLAQTLGLQVGQEIVLGGLTDNRLTRVKVVGIHSGDGLISNQLVMPLPTARHITGKPPGTVQYIRASRVPDSLASPSTQIENITVSSPTTVPSNSTFTAAITVRNTQQATQRVPLDISFGSQNTSQTIRVNAGQQETVTIRFETGQPGNQTLRVNDKSQSIEVVSPDAIRLRDLPDTAPANTSLRVIVQNPLGEPQPNVTVETAVDAAQTDQQGRARIRLGSADPATIRITTDNRSRTYTVGIVEGSERQLDIEATVSPRQPDLLTRPRLTIRFDNPWNTSLTRTVSIIASGERTELSVTVAAGRTRTRTVELARQSPGMQAVDIQTSTGRSIQVTYQVTGDERIASVLAGSDAGQNSGFAQAIEALFGNLQLLIVALSILAGMMTIGGTAAVFSQSIHAQLRTVGIYRATGATPNRMFLLIIKDTVRIAVVAAALGACGGSLIIGLLRLTGFLTVFGVTLGGVSELVILFTAICGGILISLVGALFVAVRSNYVEVRSLIDRTN